MKKLVALLVALTMVLTMTAVMAANSPQVGDNYGTTNNNTNLTVTAEAGTLSFKKIDLTVAATALLEKLAAAKQESKISSVIPGVADDTVVHEAFSVIPDFENENNLIETTADLTNASDVAVILAMTSEDSAEAAFDFIAAESVEVTESGALKPVYADGTAEAAKAAATITMIITSAPLE